MDTAELIFDTLSADGATTAALATHQGAPAIFSDAAPDAFRFEKAQPKPCVVIAAALSDDADDTFTDEGRQVRQDIRLYQFKGTSSAGLDSLAKRVRALFHNKETTLSPTVGRVVISTVAGPVEAPTTDPSVIGRRLTLRLNIEEN